MLSYVIQDQTVNPAVKAIGIARNIIPKRPAVDDIMLLFIGDPLKKTPKNPKGNNHPNVLNA